MRKKIVAGNWKMNNGVQETEKLINEVKDSISILDQKNVRVIVAPSFVSLTSALENAKNSKIEVAAQNMHQEKNGAYTGEI